MRKCVLMAKRYGLVEYLTTGQRPQTEGRRQEQVAKDVRTSPKKSLVSLVSKTIKKRKESQLTHGKASHHGKNPERK
eukprot:jgi/Picsp_1/752/NSC_04241-R1_---NA---